MTVVNNLTNQTGSLNHKMHESSQGFSADKHRQKFLKTPGFGSANPVKEGMGKKVLNTALNLVDKVQRKIENGGFLAEFLAVDLLGMIIPRTVQAYLRNRKELGHLNHKAGSEEAIREVFSGTSFFVIPMTLLAASGKIFGKGSRVKFSTLKRFKKDIVEGIVKPLINKNSGKNGNFVGKFYDGLVEKMYGNKKPEISELFQNLHNAHKKADKKKPEGIFRKIIEFFYKPESKEIKTAKSNLVDKMIAVNKDIGTAKEHGISLADSAKINFPGYSRPQNINNIIDDSMNYSLDVVEKLEKNPSMLDKIHEFKEGARKIITTMSVLTLSGFLYSIPYMYKMNKQFPGINGLTEESLKNNKEKKGRAA